MVTGMWSKEDVRPYIKFRHAVRDVKYDSAKDNFSVKVIKNLSSS